MKKVKNQEELSEIVGKNDVTIVKYGAGWCGPCRTIESIISEIESKNMDSAEFIDVDVDEADEEFINEQGIRNIPVIQFYKNGELVDKTVGALTKSSLLQKINEYKYGDER